MSVDPASRGWNEHRHRWNVPAGTIQTADIAAATVTPDKLSLTVLSATLASDQAITANTATQIAAVTLTAGTWRIEIQAIMSSTTANTDHSIAIRDVTNSAYLRAVGASQGITGTRVALFCARATYTVAGSTAVALWAISNTNSTVRSTDFQTAVGCTAIEATRIG